jgi:hypothetical protein
LRVLGYGDLPIRYLDSSTVPDIYKVRKDDAKPIPLDVLQSMQAASEKPWEVRDRLLSDLTWYGSYNEWKAAALNRLFEEQGALHQRANITAPTIAHGEAALRAEGRADYRRRLWADFFARYPAHIPKTAHVAEARRPKPETPQRNWTGAEQLIVSRSWSRWEKWRAATPAAADEYRRKHQDESGDLNWLLAFGSFEVPKGKNSWTVEECRDAQERRLLKRVLDDARANPSKYGQGRSCALCAEPASSVAVFLPTAALLKALERPLERKWVLVFGVCRSHRECGNAASQIERQLGRTLFADARGAVLVDAEVIGSMRAAGDAGGGAV